MLYAIGMGQIMIPLRDWLLARDKNVKFGVKVTVGYGEYKLFKDCVAFESLLLNVESIFYIHGF